MEKKHTYNFNKLRTWALVIFYGVIYLVVSSQRELLDFDLIIYIMPETIAGCLFFIALIFAAPLSPNGSKKRHKTSDYLPWVVLAVYLYVMNLGNGLNFPYGYIGYLASCVVVQLECLRRVVLLIFHCKSKADFLRVQYPMYLMVATYIATLLSIKIYPISDRMSIEKFTITTELVLYLKIVFTSLALGLLLIDVVKFYLPRKKTDVGHLMLIVITLLTIVLCII